jgi:hypothetical protein
MNLVVLVHGDILMQSEDANCFATPQKLAKETGLHVITILKKIRSGELKASNVSTSLRPRWIITRSDFQQFLDECSNQTTSACTRTGNQHSRTKKDYLS